MKILHLVMIVLFLISCNYGFSCKEETKKEEEVVIICPAQKSINSCNANSLPQPLSLTNFKTVGNVNSSQLSFKVDKVVDDKPDFTATTYTYLFTSASGNEQTCKQTYNIAKSTVKSPNLHEIPAICQDQSWSYLAVNPGKYKFYADDNGKKGAKISNCNTPNRICSTAGLDVDTSTPGTYNFWISKYVVLPNKLGCESNAGKFSVKVYPKPEATLITKTLNLKVGESINLMDVVYDNDTGFWSGKNIINFSNGIGGYFQYFKSNKAGKFKLYYTVANDNCGEKYLLVVNVKDAGAIDVDMEEEYRINNETQFKLYPNPANEKVSIELTHSIKETNELYLMDIKGKILYESTFRGKQTSIDLSNVPKGIYLIEVKNSQKLNLQKLIKH